MSKQDSITHPPVRGHDEVLGYLLKHAHLALEERCDRALAEFGVTTRDLGVLRVIAGGEARSQQEVAAVLGVDRTSMVALLDGLERSGIISRRPSESDRRRNVLALTGPGWELFDRAEQASIAAEREFTENLSTGAVGRLSADLASLLTPTTRAEP